MPPRSRVNIYPDFPRIVLVDTCCSGITINSAPPALPTHKSIPVWTLNFVSSYPKVKLENEYLRKISPDGLKVKKEGRSKGNELGGASERSMGDH